MNDGLGVGGFESIGHLVAIFRDALNVYGLPGNAVFKSVAFEVLHHDETLAFILIHVIDRADMRMIQGGGGPCFALKTLDSQRLSGKLFRKEFQGYMAAEPKIFGFIHHSHATAAELFENAVVENGLPDHGEGTAINKSY